MRHLTPSLYFEYMDSWGIRTLQSILKKATDWGKEIYLIDLGIFLLLSSELDVLAPSVSFLASPKSYPFITVHFYIDLLPFSSSLA